MRSYFKRYGFLAFCLWGYLCPAYAQDYRYEAGGGAGIGFYLGDSNPDVLFKNVYPVIGLQIRHHINYRWSLRGDLKISKIYGSTDNYPFYFFSKENITFERNILDAGIRVEFNFRKYGDNLLSLNTRRSTPFIFVGGGWLLSSPAEINYTGFTIPGGVGFKYKISRRINLIVEISGYLMFTDKLDVTNEKNSMLNDPYKIKSSIFKNKDSYLVGWVSLTWDFAYRNIYCK